MKKTIIAAAVAAAVSAPAAFADVKVSGMVAFETQDNDAVTTGQEALTYTDLVFSGSEDLGNGMKASFKYHLYNDQAVTGGSGDAVADTTVGLSGDFGSIRAGRFELANMAMFEGYVNVANTNTHNLEDSLGDTGGRDNGAGIEYVSPSFNGLTVKLGTQMTAKQADDSTASTKDLDITDVTVMYSNGPLSVAAGQYNYADATNDMEVTNIAATYKMGDFTVQVMNRDVKNDTGSTAAASDGDSTTYGVAYAMGNNSIGIATRDSDVSGDDGDVLVKLTHSMSKSTELYLQHRADDENNKDATLIGLSHKF
jgi:predicted porin